MHADSTPIRSVDTSALYRAQDCANFFSIGISTWWSWSRTGKIRPGVKIGPKTTVWEGSYLLQIKQQLLTEEVNCRVASGLKTPLATPVADDTSSASSNCPRAVENQQ